MTTRTQREYIFTNNISHRIRGLSTDPCLSGYLNELERADANNLNQMTESLIAEVRRSGYLAGYGLELAISNLAMDVPQPRQIRCEQMEGLSKVPGDIWLDWKGKRFEFQCKHSLNWSVELMVNKAIDEIEKATMTISPGYHFEIRPEPIGNQLEWGAFSNWVIKMHTGFAVGVDQEFKIGDRLIATFKLMSKSSSSGLRFGSSWSPGGVQSLDIEVLRKKLREALKDAKRSISAVQSAEQINCLVVDFDHFMIEDQEIFSALYGDYVYNFDGKRLVPSMKWDGLFFTDNLDLWSAVVFAKIKECDPLKSYASIFPNPKYTTEVKEAFDGFPRCKVIANTSAAEF